MVRQTRQMAFEGTVCSLKFRLNQILSIESFLGFFLLPVVKCAQLAKL